MNRTISKSKLGILACFVAALALACIVLLLYEPQPGGGLELESNAMTGTMPGTDITAQLAAMQGELDESKVAFSVNTSPSFANGRAEGKLMLENPANNAKLLTAEIVLDATGETIYRSKAISPGTYLEKIRLEKPLPRGEYPATVYLKAYHLETQKLIGQTGAAVTISVLA